MAKLVSRATLRPLDYVLIVGPILTAGTYSVLMGEFDVLGFIVLAAGVMGVVLSAKRSILNFIFGLVNVGLYAYIAYKSNYYGGAALHALYYVPMQFVGYRAWRRHSQSDDESRVQARSMTRRQIVFWSVASAAAIAALTFVLDRYTADSQPLKDAAITVIAVVAQYLMTCAYWEQWVLWLAINLLSVTLWTVGTVKGEPHAALMVVKYAFYSVNAVNGIIQWRRQSRTAERERR